MNVCGVFFIEKLDLEPGEPVPPGLEEVIIKNCLIQPKLDSWKSSPLIGLEFLVELTQCNFDDEIYYYCLLCDKNGSQRNIFIHFTSIFHYMKYLVSKKSRMFLKVIIFMINTEL